MEQVPLRHPGIAAALPFVFNGLVQLYNGQPGKGKGLIITALPSLNIPVLIIGSIIIGIWLLGKPLSLEVVLADFTRGF